MHRTCLNCFKCETQMSRIINFLFLFVWIFHYFTNAVQTNTTTTTTTNAYRKISRHHVQIHFMKLQRERRRDAKFNMKTFPIVLSWLEIDASSVVSPYCCTLALYCCILALYCSIIAPYCGILVPYCCILDPYCWILVPYCRINPHHSVLLNQSSSLCIAESWLIIAESWIHIALSPRCGAYSDAGEYCRRLLLALPLVHE